MLSLYPGGWDDKCSFQRCGSFYREAVKLPVKTGPYAGTDCFSGVDKAFSEKADLTDHRIQREQSKLFTAADDLLKRFRGDVRGPELIIDCLLMMVPTIEPLGRCAWFPTGLGSPVLKQLTPDMLHELTRSLETTATFQLNKEGGKEHKRGTTAAEKAAKKALDKKVRQEKKLSKKRGEAEASTETQLALVPIPTADVKSAVETLGEDDKAIFIS